MPGLTDLAAPAAALSDLLPPGTARRRPRGLARIPERYRLQFLLLAASRMPGKPEAEVAAVADRLAGRTRIPARLLDRTDELDEWFRGQAQRIAARLDTLLAALWAGRCWGSC